MWGVGGLSLVLAFAAFLFGSRFTVVPLLGFVGTVAYGWHAHQAETARGLTLLTTVVTIVVLGLIAVYTVLESLPAFRLMGARIFTTVQWNAGGPYGLIAPIHGTVVTTTIATMIAAPLGIAGALFIAEIAPDRVGAAIKPAVEILAGIPSIVYGFIGFAILNRYLFYELELSSQGSLFLAGVVIGLMALPTVVSVAEDAITSVPESAKSGSLALGATDWQTMKSITVPAAFSGVAAAVLLGVGRAVGETMAATVILGGTVYLPDPLYDVFGNSVTLTSLIASQYGDASSMQLSALFAAGVTLFVVVMIISVVAQSIEHRMKRKLEAET